MNFESKKWTQWLSNYVFYDLQSISIILWKGYNNSHYSIFGTTVIMVMFYGLIMSYGI